MSDKPKVSVVIPCWNAESHVGDAIRSVLAQTFRSFEIVAIDDGSTDGTVGVLKSFGDAIRWESGPNRGACAARNRGVAMARADAIQFLDSDDMLHPDRLEKMVAALARFEGAIPFSARMVVAEEGGAAQRVAVTCGDDPVVFAVQKIILLPTPLYPRAALDSVGGFDETLRCAQDYDLNLRIAIAGWRFAGVEDALVTIRRRAGSVSANSVKVMEHMQEILGRAHVDLKKRGALTDARARAIAGRMATSGRACLRHGREDVSERCFGEARSIHPDGGLPEAYGRAALAARRLFGPRFAERIAMARKGSA